MANPTTNFGWVMPTSTSLVTNLPADFNTFGQAVDTSMSELLGGTTGQVLSKTSNTNMDFTWVTPTDQTPLTTKGDLFTFSTVDARLAVGANGETLVADSAATTGLRYSATPSASNPIINSAFQIWQRGTSIAGSASVSNYTADRWLGYTAATSTFSRQATGDTTNLPNIQYAMRVQRTAGGTGTDHFYLTYSQESVNSIPYAGKSVTISFYARKGANFNDGTAGLSLVVGTGTGTDQNFLSGYTGSVTALNQPLTLTTTWVRYSYNLNIGATATELGFYFNHRASATAAGAADYYEVTGVQIDVGSVALPFRTYAATIQGELAACQRYLPAIMVGSGNRIYGYGTGATQSLYNATFPVTARVAPTGITAAAVANFTLLTSAGATGTPTSLVFDSAGVNSISLTVNNTAASPTIAANTVCQLAATASGAYILFTGCEL